MKGIPSVAGGWTLATLICVVFGVSGCTLSAPKQATSHLTITERIAHSVFVAVVSGTADGPSLARLVAATARPGEDIDVLQAWTPGAVLAAAASPPPAEVVVPGRPSAPGPGATSFQQAGYRRDLTRWQSQVTEAKKAVATRTHATLAAWTGALGITRKVSLLPHPARQSGSLSGECAIAANALAGLDELADTSFGDRRVVLLYVQRLDGGLPSGELSGDDVIAVTPFVPSAARAGLAQENLLAAGAATASIIGAESTAAQLSQIVTLGLSQKLVFESLSSAALFANNSAQLEPRAARVLMPLIAPLREAGATAVINGFASTPGSRQRNYLLSYARAASVAAFLEARGIPASSLDIVGHGASDPVAAGPSSANRRVIVTVEKPTDS